jgi:hypothetical protein
MSTFKNNIQRLKLLAFKGLRRLSRVPGFRKIGQELLIFCALRAMRFHEKRSEEIRAAREERLAAVGIKVAQARKVRGKTKRKRNVSKQARKRNR